MAKRGQNEGSIYKRRDGRWVAVVNLGWRDDRRWRKSFYGRTRREVQDKITAALRAHQLGLPVAPERMTVAQFLKRWLEDVVRPNTRPKTFQTYSDFVNHHIEPALGRFTLSKLAPQHVQAFMNGKLKAGLSPRTVKHLRDTLRNALNVAVKWGLLVRNVSSLVGPPRIPKNEIRPFTPEEAQQFLAATRGHRLEALFTVTLCLGLRQGETLGLSGELRSASTQDEPGCRGGQTGGPCQGHPRQARRKEPAEVTRRPCQPRCRIDPY